MVTPSQSKRQIEQKPPIKAWTAGAFSMAGLFESSAAHLSGALAPLEALTRIKTVSSLFPPMSGAILECRLDAGCSSLDLSLRATASDGGREFFAGVHPAQFPDAFAAEPVWRRIRDFCIEWMNGDSPIHRRVENIWLEFDLDSPPAKAPLPCVFFDHVKDDPADSEWISECALPMLLGEAVSPSTRRNLNDCFQLLPLGAKIHYVGAMLARRTDAIRLNLTVDTERIFDCLAFIGLKSGFDQIQYIATLVHKLSSKVTLNLDVSETIQSKVGIEISPDSLSDWPLLLDELVVGNLCAPAKRDGLLAWPGYSGEFAATRGQPGISLIALCYPGAPGTILSVRRLNHIKIIYEPHRLLEAKAYLYAGFGLRGSKRQPARQPRYRPGI